MKSKVLKPLNRLCPDVYPSGKRVVAKCVTKNGLLQCQVNGSPSKVNQSHLVKYIQIYFQFIVYIAFAISFGSSLFNRDVDNLYLSRVTKIKIPVTILQG